MTSSQMRDAMAWMHFPGQSSESAVCVIDPRRPKRGPEGHMSATNGECKCIYQILLNANFSFFEAVLSTSNGMIMNLSLVKVSIFNTIK